MDTTPALNDLLARYYGVFDARSGQPSQLDAILAPDWKNYSNDSAYADKPGFIALLAGIQQAVPDLRWRICEVLSVGERVVVRGEGSGRPTAPLFGVPPSGRAFSIMSMDIHTIRDGRIQHTFHLEDWASALRQISPA